MSEGMAALPRARLLVFAPLAGFLALTALFVVSLRGGDPARIPSALIGKSAPAFALPALPGTAAGQGFSRADLTGGHVTLVNIFASWCVPCRDEHPLLQQLARDPSLAAKGVRLAGIAYKDEPKNAQKFLDEMGNPYALIGVDLSGRTGIDWGVYGVPETFVVRGDGIIAYKFIGPLTQEGLATLLPQVARAVTP